ncbi:MFS transporter [Rhodococcus sp. ACPA4]|jgi:metabolite-proton symporter|uniref:MFS transporter n=2 Tax=Nocardiaceae TaxID=85025 RepID=A0ABU4C0A5_RHOGO|nr:MULTISPECIES: MFS transporter [Rhodococcus]NMD64085.1 MHS family MFS transporter [Nocardia globerula]KJF19464.1 Inner membrane metabolite transport protein yhjE [Rhodococcus sp. AD45]MCE4265198.1 MHS family MFS transporter [Rhodococcus globerulus]MDV6269931.1 MFS transporter [Rhodococcus globerulus]MDV8070426.1 MFS transporter [Rhodococcus sp. IEGM 1366]
MTSTATPHTVRAAASAKARKAALGSFVGTAIEWYDFFIYGTAAALVLGTQFFPGTSELAGTLAAFATLAVGFIARPIGGIVMGHFGDRIGRKSMLVLSLLLMGGATVAIGLLPNYDSIGVFAPVLLVTFRFIQGLGVGGEWGGAVLVATENAPEGKKGLYGAAPQIGVPAGVLMANLVYLPLAAFMDDSTFNSWGWRIPFLLSAVLVGVAMWIRLGLEESDEFTASKDDAPAETLPILEVLTKHWKTVLLAGGTFIATNGIAYAYMVYVLKYGEKELGFSKTTMLFLLIASCPFWMAGMAFSAHKSDSIGRRTVYIRSSIALVVAAAAFFPLMDTAIIPAMLFAMIGLGFTLGCCAGPQSALFAELFPAHIRYSGASLGYQIGAILGGGLAPMIATALFAGFGTSLAITVYFVGIAVISLVSILLLPEPSAAQKAS